MMMQKVLQNLHSQDDGETIEVPLLVLMALAVSESSGCLLKKCNMTPFDHPNPSWTSYSPPPPGRPT